MVPSAGVIWKQPIFKMEKTLPSCTKVEMLSVFQFLNEEGIKHAEVLLPHSPFHTNQT
jgi:hypothetical protein